MIFSGFIFALTFLPEVKIFQEYLRIPSVHPNPDYVPCVEFLQRQAKRLDLPISITYPGSPDRPVVLISWIGTQPELPSILLNSHMDVVQVTESEWTYPPFSAHIDRHGDIYARGTQDSKGSGIQFLEAVRKLKTKGIRLKRSVHIHFVPDEEIGGALGMEAFINSDDFKKLNVGFGIGEGGADNSAILKIFYGERAHWQLTLHCHGPTGHASLFLKDTAGEKLNRITTKFMEFRQQEMERFEQNSSLSISDVTTINLTILKGGEQINVVPGTLSVSFDLRIAAVVSHDEFEAMIRRWCEEAGGNIDIEFLHKTTIAEPTRIDDSNPYWIAFRDALVTDLNYEIRTEMSPFASDSRFLRAIGIPVMGFTPKMFTEVRSHANDEYLNVVTFLKGIKIFEKVLLRVGNLE